MGLAFKPETDYIRETPSSILYESLNKRANLAVFDLETMDNETKKYYDKLIFDDQCHASII